MPSAKCSDIASLKNILKQKIDVEKQIVDNLSPDLAELYHNSLHSDWAPIEKISGIYSVASRILFPDSPNKCCELGKTLAKEAYSGIYRVFLRVPSIKFLMSRAANIWKTYYDKGHTEIENIKDDYCDFVVVGFPELTKELRETILGNILMLLNMAGMKKVDIKHVDTNPEKWVWQVSWEK